MDIPRELVYRRPYRASVPRRAGSAAARGWALLDVGRVKHSHPPRRPLGFVLHPTPDSRTIPLVLFPEYFLQLGFFHGDHDPVDVGHGEGQEQHGPDLPQDSGLSEIREGEADIHRIPAEAIGTPGD